MPNGGGLAIRAACSEQEVRVTITDTGTGIAADQIPLLFVPFHTTKPEGTGLGLYVVQEVAAAHHGRVTVSSEMGVGTSFTLILPVWNADESALEPR